MMGSTDEEDEMRLRPTLDDEEYHICPFDRQHTMPFPRFPYHLARCSERRDDLIRCKWNSTHFIHRAHVADHDRKCLEKRKLDQQTTQSAGSEWDDPEISRNLYTPSGMAELRTLEQRLNSIPVFAGDQYNTNPYDKSALHTSCRGCEEGINFSQSVCNCCYLVHPQVLTASRKNLGKPSRGLNSSEPFESHYDRKRSRRPSPDTIRSAAVQHRYVPQQPDAYDNNSRVDASIYTPAPPRVSPPPPPPVEEYHQPKQMEDDEDQIPLDLDAVPPQLQQQQPGAPPPKGRSSMPSYTTPFNNIRTTTSSAPSESWTFVDDLKVELLDLEQLPTVPRFIFNAPYGGEGEGGLARDDREKGGGRVPTHSTSNTRTAPYTMHHNHAHATVGPPRNREL